MASLEQWERGLVDDLNRNIGLLNGLAKLEDRRIGPAEVRQLATLVSALAYTMRGIVSAVMASRGSE